MTTAFSARRGGRQLTLLLWSALSLYIEKGQPKTTFAFFRFPVQAVKAAKFEERYDALIELLNQEAQARAGTTGRETARYRQQRALHGNLRLVTEP